MMPVCMYLCMYVCIVEYVGEVEEKMCVVCVDVTDGA